jgi:hypothetical protein
MRFAYDPQRRTPSSLEVRLPDGEALRFCLGFDLLGGLRAVADAALDSRGGRG